MATGRSATESYANLIRGISGTDTENYEGNARLSALNAQQEAEVLQRAIKSGELGSEAYAAAQARLKELSGQVGNFDPNVRNYANQATQNAGTLGENTLASNAVNLLSQDVQQQQMNRNALAFDTARDPLQQYRSDADLKRAMAKQNQLNLAQNVRDQLTQLGNARQSNASLISNIMGQQRQTF